MTDETKSAITVVVNVADDGRLQANVSAPGIEPKIQVNVTGPQETELRKRMHAIIEDERRRPPGAGAAAYRTGF